ncbi:MAG: DEAD/DEAH box helicase [Burkholderiaceae bacterium]|nr:DEAD/DEAH box helicase [Burkholderiaceae bacterium]
MQGLITAQLQFDYQGHRGWWGLDGAPALLDAPAADAAGQGEAQGAGQGTSQGAAQGAVGAVVADESAAAAAAQAATEAAKPKRILLVRQPEAERAAFARLQALGLLGTDAGRFYLPGPALQSTWLEWFEQDFAPLRVEGFALTLAPELAGWVRHADVLDVRMRPEGAGAGGAEGEGLHEGDDSTSPWFTLSLGMEIDGQRHNILPWLPDLIAAAAAHPPNPVTGEPTLPPHVFLPMPGGDGFVRLPTEPLKPWMAALLELVGERGHDFVGDELRLSRLEALRASAALGEGAQWQGAEALRALLQQLRGQAALPEVPVPASVQASLRPYQQQGLNWLQFLRTHGLAGILADDMGLGKTLQTLAHLQVEKDAGRLDRPALIIAPVSLLGNWQREAARFCPQLRSLVLHGKERHEVAQTLAEYDLVIAPYSILPRDRERWLQNRWHLVVLDEAHHIKNASTHAAQVVYALDTRHRLCLTGTPMENHLGEIWSLFHFLMPGFLGSQKRFTELYRTPIEKHGDAERLAQLRARITPFMLRRTKALVAHELPPKVETVLRVQLSGAQANLYETIRLGMEKTVRDALAAKGLAKSQITILDALLKLRQVCCDPRLVPLDAAKKVKTSAKLEQLMELLPEMLAEGRRILLFSQFTSMLTRIEEELQKHKLQWAKLTGQTRKRDEVIERFTSGEVPLFLISLKAGGVGLNLPQADTVIHYDPWWNPAVEAQATDRAHRIGQTQSVWVLKLVAQGTIEERILALQERKAELANSMYSGASARKEPLFTEDDLAELLRPLE